MHQERQLNRANFCETQRDLQIDLEFPFEMAKKPDDSVRVYTTDTVVDNPRAKVAYKGLIFVNCEGFGPIVELRAELIENAKKAQIIEVKPPLPIQGRWLGAGQCNGVN